MLKNYTIKVFIIAFIATFSTQGVSQAPYDFSDDFESYDVGSYLAKSSDTWTTWSGAEGGQEDTKISDVQAKSGTKSVYFKSTAATGGPTDLVFPMPEVYEVGTVVFDSDIFVEEGKGGYFNFQGASKLGEVYTIDVYMVNDGKFYITQSGNSILSINSSYPKGSWFNLKITGDLTVNKWSVEIDNVVVGTFSSIANKFASIDFYPVNSTSVGGNDQSSYYLDNFKIEYIPFTPLQNDAAVLSVSTSTLGLTGDKNDFSGKLINVGIDTIRSFEAKWAYGSSNGTQTFSNLELKTLDRYDFTFEDSIALLEGNNTLYLEVISLNGNLDNDSTNNVKSIITTAVTPAPNKKYVGEELTGTWCGWCPRGAVALDYMANKYPDFFIGIAVHGGNNGYDPMEESNDLYPGSAILAGKLTNNDWGFPGLLSMRNDELDPGNVEASFIEEIQKPIDATIVIGSSYDEDSRNLSVSVSTSFLNDNDNKYKVSVILVESGVKGTSSKWRQTNNYSNREPALIGAGHNWKTEPNPVPATKMVYNDVGRACLGGYKGVGLNNSHTTSDEEVLNFKYTIPADFNTDNLELVALILNLDGSINNGEKVSFDEALENGFVEIFENIDFHNIVINEFLASSDSLSGIADQDGEYDDWIELYNNTNKDVNLSNVYLSDKFSKPQAWQFPAGTTIEANSYLIVWADKDTDQDGLHAKLKLSSGGEELLLTNGDGTVIDSLTFSEQTTNVAMARVPNGTGDFIFKDPTFNGTNVPEATIELEDNNVVNIYPVPTRDFLIVEFVGDIKNYQVSIVNLMGKKVLYSEMKSNKNSLDISSLGNGIYTLQILSKGHVVGNARFTVIK